MSSNRFFREQRAIRGLLLQVAPRMDIVPSYMGTPAAKPVTLQLGVKLVTVGMKGAKMLLDR